MNSEQYFARLEELHNVRQGVERARGVLRKAGMEGAAERLLPVVWRVWLEADLLGRDAVVAGARGPFKDFREGIWTTLDSLGGLMGEW